VKIVMGFSFNLVRTTGLWRIGSNMKISNYVMIPLFCLISAVLAFCGGDYCIA